MKAFQLTASRIRALRRIAPILWLLILGAGVFFGTGSRKLAAAERPPCCRELKPGTAFTDGSLYQLDSEWTSDVGQKVKLDVFAGRPQVVAMFFTRCEFTCPITVSDLQRIEAALPREARERVDFLLVSFDSKRDTAEILRAYRQSRKLPEAHWSLLRGEADDVRELAALLGVNYKQDARGQFAHSNIITLLNGKGEIAHQQMGLNQPTAGFVSAIEQTLKD
jgi:protein SCO1/2